MTFLPARMSRLLVGGHKSKLEGVIEALHREGVVHIEDYRDPAGVTSIGTPLEAGDQASALLVRVRGLQKALGAEGFVPVGAVNGAANLLAEAESATAAALERLRAVREAQARTDAEESALRPFAGLDLDLGSVAGLRSVKVLVGTSRSDPTAALSLTNVPHELQVVPSGGAYAVALVVPAATSGPAEKALAESGFVAAALPAGNGTPSQRLAALATEKAKLEADAETAAGDVAVLRQTWGARLAALEAVLSDEVARTQAPLHFGVTETTFHVEGWVPRGQVKAVEEALLARFGDALYFHDLGDAPPQAHGAHGGGPGHGEEEHHAAKGDAAHGDAHGDGHDDHHGSDPEDEPPIHLANPKPARPYEWILSLLARPRYQEIDPSKLMLFFFPLFFGLMVGDVIVGLLILLLGLWLRKNKLIGIGGPAVGKAIVAGGIVSILVGAFVFGEALGLHFVTADPAEKSWENTLGLHIPFESESHGLLYKTGSPGAHGTEPAAHATEPAVGEAAPPEGGTAITTHAAEGKEVPGILSPHSDVHLAVGGVVLGWYSKIHDVQPLLVWSLIIALVHINLGLVLGFRNVRKAHGALLALQEKGAWIMLQVGTALAVLTWFGRPATGLSDMGWFAFGAGLGLVATSLVLLWMGAAKVMGQGFISILEIPSLIGNIVSYTRLAAIGASKAGLGLALGIIAFETAGGGILGWILYVVGFLGITALAVLTGSLQSLRLQFVEFFGKFFTGGGRPYVPFARRAP